MEDTDEPVSKACKSGFPAYLFHPPPSALGLEDLRKHGIISDIEKNRALTKFINKATCLIPALHTILKQMDKSNQNNLTNDHTYQVPDQD